MSNNLNINRFVSSNLNPNNTGRHQGNVLGQNPQNINSLNNNQPEIPFNFRNDLLPSLGEIENDNLDDRDAQSTAFLNRLQLAQGNKDLKSYHMFLIKMKRLNLPKFGYLSVKD